MNMHKNARLTPLCREEKRSSGEVVIEVVIGDVIVRAGADVSEAHLQRVIRAVRWHDPLRREGVPRQSSVDFRKGL
ncbi:hypothetical protein [Ensifer aridi]|uniref:hypothetical protein n=1 Tax=Ensifer aridi TaxID=1708715 RepID=UPI00196A154F|nr:hypothetical protein [Ensifer aridi]